MRAKATKKKNTLNKTVRTAAQKLRAASTDGLMDRVDILRMAQGLVGKEVYESWQLMERREDWDGKPYRARVAEFENGWQGWTTCGATLLLLRADTYRTKAVQMVLRIEHPENRAPAYIDCETGAVELTARWPKSEAAKGERRFVLATPPPTVKVTVPRHGYTLEQAQEGDKLERRWTALFNATWDTSSTLYDALQRRINRVNEALAALRRSVENKHAIVLCAGGAQ